MVENENRKEMEVRQALEPHLAPGEQLLAYASGNVAGATSQPYYLGLNNHDIVCGEMLTTSCAG